MRVEADMTIYTAASVKDALLAAIARDESANGTSVSRGPRLDPIGDVELDLGGVGEIDTAGLQLLLLARREAAARGAKLRVANPSVAVRELLALCQLDGAFGVAAEGTT